jgi:hypothetical protein
VPASSANLPCRACLGHWWTRAGGCRNSYSALAASCRRRQASAGPAAAAPTSDQTDIGFQAFAALSKMSTRRVASRRRRYSAILPPKGNQAARLKSRTPFRQAGPHRMPALKIAMNALYDNCKAGSSGSLAGRRLRSGRLNHHFFFDFIGFQG